MAETPAEAFAKMLEQLLFTTVDLIACVIFACDAKNSIDLEKLREALENAASNPTATKFERAPIERLLAVINGFERPSS